jgi:hypothetical protein
MPDGVPADAAAQIRSRVAGDEGTLPGLSVRTASFSRLGGDSPSQSIQPKLRDCLSVHRAVPGRAPEDVRATAVAPAEYTSRIRRWLHLRPSRPSTAGPLGAASVDCSLPGVALQVQPLASDRAEVVGPLQLPQLLFDHLAAEVRLAAPLETGFVGVGTHDRVSFLVPRGPEAVCTPASFQPDIDFQTFAVRRIRLRQRNLGSLVYFHSHPSGPGAPSAQDRRTCADACEEFRTSHLDVGIAVPTSRSIDLRVWRYHANRGVFSERQVQRIDRRDPAPSSPYDPGFAWHQTPTGHDRLLLEEFELHRRGWALGETLIQGARVTLAVRRSASGVVAYPTFFPFEPPLVIDQTGASLWPGSFAWNSLRSTAELLEALEPT